MKQMLKTLVTYLVIAFILGAILIANGIFGNPISKAIVTSQAKSYIETTYSNTDYYLDDVRYSFKIGGYYAHIKSKSSPDTYFSVSYNFFGQADYDNFDSYVTSGFNTWDRINSDYRSQTNKILDAFPYPSEIAFGEIQTQDKSNSLINFGVDMQSLELDKAYNLYEMGKQYGKITLYVDDSDVSIPKVMEILKTVKNQFDASNQAFYAIDFVLQTPKTKDNGDDLSYSEIRLESFLYEHIDSDDFESKVQQSIVDTQNFYDEKDKMKEKELTGCLN